jgi:hypothetical protein
VSYDSDIDKVRKKAEQQGWRYDKTTGGHHRFFSPDKESIVTASGTPGDQRGWLNFLADMKRAGYKDDFGALGVSLGEALLVAQEKLVIPPIPNPVETTNSVEEERSVSITEHVRSLLRNNPTKVYHVQDVLTKVKAVSKKASVMNVGQALTSGAKLGTFKRVGGGKSGQYQWGGDKVLNKTPTEKSEGKAHVLGVMTGDEAFDADLAKLDEALAALGTIEEVVKRTREKLFKLAEIKKLLGG